MRKIYILGAMACMMAACKPGVNINNPVSAGNAVFTNYLAIGSSFTAGAADNSIYVSSQVNSYPKRLFEQFQTVAGNKAATGPFIQPLLLGNDGYPTLKLVLGTIMDTCQGTSSLGPVPSSATLNAFDGNLYVSPANNHQINNIGAPLLRVADMPVAGYANGNKFAKRFYYNLAGSPMDELHHAVYNLYPTFFTFWLGPEDILGYALNGGQGNGVISGAFQAQPIGGNYYNPNDITPLSVFENLYDSALNVAMSTGASGALINIPDFTNVPFFTTIPADGLFLSRQGQADTLNAYWKPKLPNLPPFHIGYNLFIITQNDGVVVRQAAPGEEILLTTPMANITCYGWGSYVPIPCQYVLTTDELQFIRAATTSFNQFIYQESVKYHLAYVDINAYLGAGSLVSGISYNGIKYTTAFVTGGAYSLDGINFTQRGYALVANQILSTINSYYHSTLPLTNVNQYLGIQFP